ncbi:hypothetical protein QEH54_12660 [Pelagicoccus sp. SDUM812003]|nr:hypothetical protein [Pelagicoccus sp. SDUM812003]
MIARDLRKAADLVQDHFTTIGEHFKKQALLTSEMLQQGRRITDSENDESSQTELFREVVELVRGSIDFLSECVEQSRDLVHHFERYRDQFESVQLSENQLSRTLTPLQIIERLFRIEAAALPLEMQAAFESLTKEIAHMYSEMRRTLEVEFQTLRETQSRITRTHDYLVDYCVRLEERSQTAKRDLEQALSEIERNLSQQTESNRKLAEAATTISGCNDAIMTGIQYQDAMRQRSEHVEHAIGDMLQTLQKTGGSPSYKSQIGQLCRLETQQVSSILSDLSQASSQIGGGLRRVDQTLVHIDQECLPEGGIEQSLQRTTCIYDTLLKTLAEARELTEIARDGAQQTQAALDSLDGTASNITTSLTELATGIKMIALNAQIQAAQMGAGTGLEVLSGRTCELSDNTSKSTKAIGIELEQLVARLEEAIKNCSETQNHAIERTQNLNTRGRELESKLVERQTSAENGLSQLGRLLEQCRFNAERLSIDPNRERAQKQLLQSVRDRLQGIADRHRQRRSEPLKVSEATSSRYTTDTERAIHQQFLQASAPQRSTKKPAPEPLATRCEVPQTENVTLF